MLIHGGEATAVAFSDRRVGRADLREADGLLIRPRTVSATAEIEYVVYALDNPPPSTTPADARRLARSRSREPLRRALRVEYLQWPGDLPAVTAAAEAALQSGGGPVDRPAARATAERLTRYLRDSGRFNYSLDLSVQDTSVDAVEDFLINKRVGHCEYFATALALMLRDRGIPSRVVTGFKGGDLNPTTRRFEVQQRHAHAWVEAYVDRRWETFDPTPAAARTQSVADSGPRFAVLSQLMSGVENVWGEYVVRMSLDRQRATFGRPFQDAWERFRALSADWAAGPDGAGWQFDGRAGALFAAFALGLAAVGWAARGLLARRWRRRRERRARAEAVRFWRRFGKLAAQRGVVRGPAETPAEFAARAAAQWAGLEIESWDEQGEDGLGSLPGRAAADLYAVRFGGATLPPAHVATLNAALDQLEARLDVVSQRPPAARAANVT